MAARNRVYSRPPSPESDDDRTDDTIINNNNNNNNNNADDDRHSNRHSLASLRAARVRAECLSPARRRAMGCCALFWIAVLVAGLLTAHGIWATVNDQQARAHIRASGGEVAYRCEEAGPDRCLSVHGPASHQRDGRCAPGYTWTNIAHARAPGIRGMCMRRHWYPRVFDASLGDDSAPVCSDVYTHSCGAWNSWFDGDEHPLETANNYHANMGAMIDASLTERDSMVYQFVTRWCRPLLGSVVLTREDTPKAWLSVQKHAQLPLWLGGAHGHTLCALGAINELVPPWFYELAVGLSAAKSKSLRNRIVKLAASRDECAPSSRRVSIGALGDMSTGQVDWQAPAGYADYSHQQFHGSLGSSYGHAWTAATALAPFSWLAVGNESRIVLRVALPRSRDEWLRQSHCERIGAVIFLEALEDRYTAAMWRQNVRPIISPLEMSTALTPRIKVSLIERPALVRANVIKCINSVQPLDWHALAGAVARCNAGHRIQPSVPLLDAFMPHTEAHRNPDDPDAPIVVHITPAVLQQPLFSPEMEMQSVAARILWIVLRAAAPVQPTDVSNCVQYQARDEWALRALFACCRDLMDRQFWLELVQLHCGTYCGAHWSTTLQQYQEFKHAFKCGSQQRVGRATQAPGRLN